jgi:FKBP-type peptidyl-prolyl cis-trans isomerase
MSPITFLKQRSKHWNTSAALLFVMLSLVFSSCDKQEDPYRNRCVATEEEKNAQMLVDVQAIKKYLRDSNIDTTDMQVTASGIHYFTIREGTGDMITSGDRVSVHYIGKHLSAPTFDASRTFDNSYPTGTPFTVYVDMKNTPGSVIEGWNQALKLMKIGGISRFYIPSYLAYGPCGSSTIFPNEVLSFEIETLRKL